MYVYLTHGSDVSTLHTGQQRKPGRMRKGTTSAGGLCSPGRAPLADDETAVWAPYP